MGTPLNHEQARKVGLLVAVVVVAKAGSDALATK